jgi:predicted outer membrane repeat protein
VSGNTANATGGGINTKFGGTIRNSTIAFNTANESGGIFNGFRTLNIGNSIVAKNTAPNSPDIGGSSYTNAGNNLIGINTGFEATFPTSSLVGTASSPVDPLLAPLADNGGATQTHALLPGSPAINAGNNALIPSGVTTDQRGAGFARIVGGTVDIGAFEVQSISPIPNPPDFSNLIVTNGNDSGAGSLRLAILTANDLAGADTITFSSNFIISLTSGELTVTDPAGLTITGNGATNTIIDGNNISRVFNITAGDITFNGVTIRNGNTTGDGGGILAKGNVTLTNSTVSSNTAGTRGGGIYADGNATLNNSTMSNNQATGGYGGGIFANGNVTLNNSTMSNNQATGGVSRGGGGIFASGNVTLTNSTVSNNQVTGGVSSDGGGIFAYLGTVTLTNSTVSGNTSGSTGGGIFADNVTLTNSTVSGNTAGGYGGGIFARFNATLTNSTVSNNQATGGGFSDGGGIFADNVTLNNSTVSNNQVTGGVSSDGGGIFANGGGTIRNSTIAFNTAKNGGGIFNNSGTIDIANSIVAKNTAGTSPDIGSSSIGTGYTNAGNNLIGINTGFEATFPASSLVGTASSPVDPLLAPLANNGGATQTHALLPGSPAINAGNNALIPSGVTTDQRGAGFARIVGGTVDIGAFEAQVVTPPPAPPDNPTPPSSDTPPRSALREESEAPKNTDQTLFGQEFVTPNFDFGLDAIEDVALGDFIARFNIAEALGAGNFAAILTLDTLFTGEFDRFLGVNPINDLNSVEKIGNMLSRLAKETGKRPAIVYLMVDERQLTIAAIPPGSRAGVARAGLVASTEPFAQREAQVQPVVRGIPEAKRANLMPVVERFLTALKDPRQRTSDAYLKDAQQLYRWFIAPIEKELQAQGIDTLLFSMDNGLRLLPVAALHDGQQFLVEKYSTALIPSVNLIDTRYRNLRDSRVLAMGADTFANQAPLPAVPVELKVITEEWPGQSFLNQEFTVQRLTQERLQGGYPIIHLATHADFAPGRLSDSYIEFGNNQRLNLPQVRELPLREPNVVELLTLSACRTSVGDVSAELGFAGLAVQAGVKSALASLWYVSDEGTLALMTEFYKNLRQAPIKAEALRQAQIAMLQGKVTIKGGELRGVRGGIPVPSAIAQRGDQVLNHPYYWAAFTLIGSPW